jgi:hypothetical protein
MIAGEIPKENEPTRFAKDRTIAEMIEHAKRKRNEE